MGNGWLTVINLGRYALSLFDKSTGKGVRVFIEPARLDNWPEIRTWFFKLKPKKDQDELLLLDRIGEAAGSICGVRHVEVAGRFRQRRHRGAFAVCPGCGESYPADDGATCLGCRAMGPYVDSC